MPRARVSSVAVAFTRSHAARVGVAALAVTGSVPLGVARTLDRVHYQSFGSVVILAVYTSVVKVLVA